MAYGFNDDKSAFDLSVFDGEIFESTTNIASGNMFGAAFGVDCVVHNGIGILSASFKRTGYAKTETRYGWHKLCNISGIKPLRETNGIIANLLDNYNYNNEYALYTAITIDTVGDVYISDMVPRNITTSNNTYDSCFSLMFPCEVL